MAALQFTSFSVQPVNDEPPETNKKFAQLDFSWLKPHSEEEDKKCAEMAQQYRTRMEMFQDNDDQKALFQVLYTGHRNNTPQFLLLLLSDYTRLHVQTWLEDKTNLSINAWINRSHAIRSISKAPMNSGIDTKAIIEAAVKSFERRACRRMLFDNLLPSEKINDSFYQFASTIGSAIALIKNENWKSPCQLDVWIMPNKIGVAKHDEQKTESDGDEDDEEDEESEDDEEEEDDDEDDDDEKHDKNEVNELVQNIGNHINATIGSDNCLKTNTFLKAKRAFIVEQADETHTRYVMIVKRHVRENEKEKEKQKEKEKDKEQDKDKAEETESNEDESGQEQKEQPQPKRLSNSSDEFYLFRPQKHPEIPVRNLPEWNINAALNDVLPASPCNTYPEIRGVDPCNGAMFLLSLYKEEDMRIRAWLFCRRSFCRFYASDIVNVLPYMFASSKQNHLTQTQYQQIIKAIQQHSIPDAQFDKFGGREFNNDRLNTYEEYRKIMKF
mmetsp:Transcript_56104/g.89299  ORF Transcript_56104/g.89299 Transcript_56104/m.89299 type:complete len:498 (+) Transcript_56104:102-1595(+)